ncbi:MAG: chromate transporter, partial [Novosphingobium sp.]
MHDTRPEPSFSELVRVFTRIGFLGFGGPAGQIALMQHEVVDQRGWVDQGAFLRALNLCNLLPGPEAQQLATWIGWRLYGTRGGLVAGGLFILPGACIMAGVSVLYALAAGLAWFSALFLGIKAAVLAIVAQALVRIAARALGTPFKRVLAVVAFVALAIGNAPFPLVILGAGLLGAIANRVAPRWLDTHALPAGGALPAKRELARQTALSVVVWLAVWAAPMVLIAATLGTDHVLWDIGAFFSQLAIVTFGGAYAVLAYMAQAAVEH